MIEKSSSATVVTRGRLPRVGVSALPPVGSSDSSGDHIQLAALDQA